MKMIVSDLMTRDPASVRSGQTLAAAAQVMWDCDCGVVPVTESEGSKLIGIVTDRDICMGTWSRGLAPGSIFVDEVMSRDLVCCSPQDTIAGVEALMRAKQIRRIPVVDTKDNLLGILSLADIARAAGDSRGRRASSDLTSDELATTLAGICRSSSAQSAGPGASPSP
jgi:CBS domain-containing protein